MNVQGVKFTTADLARELGISKRTIYEYFTSKEDLMESALDTILTDLRQQIAGVVDDDSLDTVARLKALMVLYPKAFGSVSIQVIEDVRRYLPQVWEKFEECFSERWRLIEKIIDDGAKQGILAKVDVVILKRMYMGTINQLLDFHFLAQHNITFNNAMANAAEVLIGGLTAPGYKRSVAKQPDALESPD
jgi:AcrR family transcriptional regulator